MKEFKAIAEQVSILESRGLQIDQETSIVFLHERHAYPEGIQGQQNDAPFEKSQRLDGGPQ